MNHQDKAKRYWRRNLQTIVIFLIIWFLISFGAGILFVDYLNQWQFFGYKLGFWFATQGSIWGFCLISMAYALWMNRLDNAFDVHE